MKMNHKKKLITLFALFAACSITAASTSIDVCRGKTEASCKEECLKLGGSFLDTNKNSVDGSEVSTFSCVIKSPDNNFNSSLDSSVTINEQKASGI